MLMTSIVDFQMWAGKDDPSLEMDSASMVKAMVWTSHKLPVFAAVSEIKCAWDIAMMPMRNFTNWTSSDVDIFRW